MATDEKLIQKFQNEPLPKEIEFSELKKYLGYYGFYVDRQTGSHVMFVHDNPNTTYPVPLISGRFVKSRYLKELNKIIKNMEED